MRVTLSTQMLEVKWVNAEHVTAENVQELVGDTDGILYQVASVIVV